MDVPVAANVLGTLGAVCWSVQLIPQLIINYRRHNATGLQPTMMMFWAWAGVPLGVYNIVSDFNVALKIQPQLLAVLSLATWSQCFYYERHWSIGKALAVTVPIGMVMGGTEVALTFALQAGVRNGVRWPVVLMAVLAALFLALGVLRHYWDIYRHRTVRGISFIFVGIDAMGDLTSLVSVMFQPTLDILGIVIYATELALWIGVFACGGYYNLAPWMRKKLQSKGRGGNCDTGANDSVRDNTVVLHEMPSSTSVFRTPSGDLPRRLPTRSTAYEM